jgi:hypothetical protein
MNTTLIRDERHLRREEVCNAPGKLCIQFKTPLATIDLVEAYLSRRQRNIAFRRNWMREEVDDRSMC